MSSIRFAIPKGSLENKTRAFFERAGVSPRGYADGGRSYRPDLGLEGVQAKTMRPQEIPYMLQAGFFDLGISGRKFRLAIRCTEAGSRSKCRLNCSVVRCI